MRQVRQIIVPGFFAADGNTAETSAKKGSIWQVRFMPNKIGEWTYEVSFKKGNEIAINDDKKAGKSVGFDGTSGSFIIKESKNRINGRLVYKNEHYLYYSESNKPFLKGGTDSPENFLGYYEFDNTPPSHKYEPHAKDWKEGNPTWQKGKGKTSRIRFEAHSRLTTTARARTNETKRFPGCGNPPNLRYVYIYIYIYI